VSARGDGSRRAAVRHRVSVADRQRAVALRDGRVRRLAARVLRAACPEGADLSVVLVDDAAIARLNAEWRGKHGPTDVLSFSQVEGLGPGTSQRRRGSAAPERGGVGGTPTPRGRGPRGGPGVVAVPPTPIGDVVISVETARRQARERRRPLDQEIGALLVHGVLHLLGYDHERTRAGARRMFAREREVAAAAGLPPVALGERAYAPGGRA
jgi:probable rRNA maturation factor